MALFDRFYRDSLLLQKADSARDARKWERAAVLYRRFLGRNRGDTAIWIQCGHALKESRQYEAAREAYTEAVVLEPQNSEAHLQLGHLLKIVGHIKAAEESYDRSFSIDQNENAYRELISLRGDGISAAPMPSIDYPGLEGRLADFGRQIDYILTHVATVKALSFEIQHIKKLLPIAVTTSPYDMFLATSKSLVEQLTDLAADNRATPQLKRDVEDLVAHLHSFESRRGDEI